VTPIQRQTEEKSMQNRRQMLARSAQLASLLATLGLLPGGARAADAAGWNSAAFDAKSMADLMKALGASAPAESKDVTLTGPDIAENGAVVPVGASTALPGVKRILLLVEKNPSMLSAIFEPGDTVEANIATRVKMGQSSNVFAVVMLADGRVLYAAKEIKVTLGGCGG
jgi:sulfur-oxidizing protein SoxY